MRRIAAATIASKRYLALARVTGQSFIEHNPGVRFLLLLADEPEGCFDPAGEPFEVLPFESAGIPHLERFRFEHAELEASYAATPFLLASLLKQGYDSVIFLKQETLVLGSLAREFDLLAIHPMLLTPHLLAPSSAEGALEVERNVLLAGVYNGGFLGVSATPESLLFLEWWQQRTLRECRHEVSIGRHFEQRWLDFAPNFVPGAHLLRDPGMNVGHWNVLDRQIEIRAGAVTACGVPCRVFRFSGFDPDEPGQLTRHNRTLTAGKLGDAAELLERYAAMLNAAGHKENRHWPYASERFTNGVAVPALARSIYRELGEEALRFGDPRDSARPDGFFAWLTAPSGRPPAPGLANLWLRIWEARQDLQRSFPKPAGRDASRFAAWCASSGVREYSLAPEFLPREPRP